MKRIVRALLTVSMRRLITLALLAALLVAGISIPRVTSVSAFSHSAAPLAKKVCKTKKVHGKKKKVCHQVKAKPTPTPVPPPVTELSSGAQIDAYLTQRQFRGIMLFAQHGQVILSKGYGMADTASSTANSPQTKYPAFAVSEFMVAVAIMKLQEAGALSVQDKICAYISDCPNIWQPITIDELLTDTSGLALYDPFSNPGGVAQTMAGCRAMTLLSTPGTYSPRSHCNPFLLSTILEKVTGKSWEDAMQSMIFGPAGMSNTGQLSNALQPPQRARGYRFGSPVAELNYDSYPMAYSTVEDIQRFDQALLAGKIISQQSLAAMVTPRLPDDPPANTVYRGYKTYLAKATDTRQPVVFEESSGDPDFGEEAGVRLDNAFSPANGSIWIYATNDIRGFTNDDENNVFDLITKLLWAK